MLMAKVSLSTLLPNKISPFDRFRSGGGRLENSWLDQRLFASSLVIEAVPRPCVAPVAMTLGMGDSVPAEPWACGFDQRPTAAKRTTGRVADHANELVRPFRLKIRLTWFCVLRFFPGHRNLVLEVVTASSDSEDLPHNPIHPIDCVRP